MAVEISQERPIIPDAASFPSSGVVFDVANPRVAELSRENRVRLYYAQELADENLDVLGRRYRVSDNDSEDPGKDILVADPLSDSQVGALASMIKTARNGSGDEKQKS